MAVMALNYSGIAVKVEVIAVRMANGSENGVVASEAC
jgi:hypothetical protein